MVLNLEFALGLFTAFITLISVISVVGIFRVNRLTKTVESLEQVISAVERNCSTETSNLERSVFSSMDSRLDKLEAKLSTNTKTKL